MRNSPKLFVRHRSPAPIRFYSVRAGSRESAVRFLIRKNPHYCNQRTINYAAGGLARRLAKSLAVLRLHDSPSNSHRVSSRKPCSVLKRVHESEFPFHFPLSSIFFYFLQELRLATRALGHKFYMNSPNFKRKPLCGQGSQHRTEQQEWSVPVEFRTGRRKSRFEQRRAEI